MDRALHNQLIGRCNTLCGRLFLIPFHISRISLLTPCAVMAIAAMFTQARQTNVFVFEST
jgi:hypothetical protein